MILHALEGVGNPAEDKDDWGEIALHIRRPMTPAEENKLPYKGPIHGVA